MKNTITHRTLFFENYRQTVYSLRLIRKTTLLLVFTLFIIKTLIPFNKALHYINVGENTFLHELLYGSFSEHVERFWSGTVLLSIGILVLSHFTLLMLTNGTARISEHAKKKIPVLWLLQGWGFTLILLFTACFALYYSLYYFEI